jgi:hypothetical protein
MKRQQGMLTETLVAGAIGLAVMVLMVSIWIADSTRRATEIDGRLEHADLNAATRYLPTLFVPANAISVIDQAAIRRTIGASTIEVRSLEGIRLTHPFSTVIVYLGRSQNQNTDALWIFQDRFGDQTQHALMDTSGSMRVNADANRICFSLSDPVWIYCHEVLPGQVIHD